ncbi:MAG TPA: VWA domain-containing protein [Chloroflexota bacterium]|nr:VWA domain-containing protein [Chloroflexota bacterium]
MRYYRYSRWDGTQQIEPFDPEELLEQLSDDLLADGDLRSGLQRLMQMGHRSPSGDRMMGLQQLLERLRQQRQQQLNRFQLNDVMKEIQEKLDEVLRTERAGIDRRLAEARQRAEGGQQSQPDQAGEQGEQGPDGDRAPSGQQTRQGQQAPGSRGQRGQRGQQGQQGGQRQPGGQAQAGSEGQPGGEQDGGLDAETLRRMLENMAAKKQQFLDELPKDLGGAVKALTEYEFMDPEAQQLFQELLQMLQQQVMQSYFQGMQQGLQQITPEDLRRTNQMLRELNEMLRERQEGGNPDFQNFMEKYGEFFPPGMENLDDLVQHLQQRMAAMQSLLDSMTPQQRRELQDLMESLFQNQEMQQELDELAMNLEQLYPMGSMRRQYPFQGDDSLSFMEAMRLMQELQEMDQLEKQLQRARDPQALDQIDADRVRELLGEEAARSLEQLKQLTKMLEEAGYIVKKGNRWELTPRGIRRIGQKALRDIFQHLKRDNFGKHESRFRGTGGERMDESKVYEFGDTFLLDLQRTVMNGVMRQGPGSPVKLTPDDFEVYRTELMTQCATVLLLDMSRSMFLRGCITAAKKVAIALNSLIRGQYPRDALYVVPFSYYAREIKPEELPRLTWNEWGYGTNMQHAFMLSRQLLARHKGGTRQIILITDGEPTAYFEGGQIEFSYPPTYRTFQETLREVGRCTRENVVINTFMLERGHYLIDFVEQMTKINRGRAFYATPERLGEYILVDYVDNKRKKVH